MTEPLIGAVAGKSKDRVVGGVAALAATAALACGACCVLPFALPAAVLALTGGVLAWFASVNVWVTAIAAVAVVGGWVWVVLQSRSTKRRLAESTLITMALATVLPGAAFAWPILEPLILSLLRP